MINPTPMPNKMVFFKTLLHAYYKQQVYEPYDYVDVYKVADIFCNDTGHTFESFRDMLARFYPELIHAGYMIALEVDGSPRRQAAVRKRKDKIIDKGATICVISMRE